MESFGHTCVLHCDPEEISFNRSLRSMETEGGSLFVRCHRSYVVNLYWIDSVQEDVVTLRSGEQLPIGESQRGELQRLWADFRQKCCTMTVF